MSIYYDTGESVGEVIYKWICSMVLLNSNVELFVVVRITQVKVGWRARCMFVLIMECII